MKHLKNLVFGLSYSKNMVIHWSNEANSIAAVKYAQTIFSGYRPQWMYVTVFYHLTQKAKNGAGKEEWIKG